MITITYHYHSFLLHKQVQVVHIGVARGPQGMPPMTKWNFLLLCILMSFVINHTNCFQIMKIWFFKFLVLLFFSVKILKTTKRYDHDPYILCKIYYRLHSDNLHTTGVRIALLNWDYLINQFMLGILWNNRYQYL